MYLVYIDVIELIQSHYVNIHAQSRDDRLKDTCAHLFFSDHIDDANHIKSKEIITATTQTFIEASDQCRLKEEGD